MRLFAAFMLTLFVTAAFAMAQQKPVENPTPAPVAVKDMASGKYDGPAKAAGVADIALSLELNNASGKVSGRLITPVGPLEISEGTLTDGKLVIRLGAAGKDGMIAARLQDEKVVGDWIPTGAPKRTVELKKVTAAVGGADLSGEWSALADAQGGFPFTLTLKIDGEKVTGSSSSQLGESSISNGSWKDGKLIFVLDTANGPIAMSATLVDGKLVGDFDYSGQLQGKWVAARK
jgi:hypothetical protein